MTTDDRPMIPVDQPVEVRWDGQQQRWVPAIPGVLPAVGDVMRYRPVNGDWVVRETQEGTNNA